MATRRDSARQSRNRENQVHTQLGRAAVQIFAANERMNQTLMEHLAPAAWRAQPPESKKARSIAAHLKAPAQLNRTHCTQQQARAGLAESGARCIEMLAEALGNYGGRIKRFRRDGWERPWQVGREMLCYMLAHEAHHRGQVRMLAHQLGFALPVKVTAGMGNWRSCGKSAERPADPATGAEGEGRFG